MYSFAERLKSARKMKGWSLQELADNLPMNISRQAISKYEQEHMKPTGEVLIALAKILEVKPDYFLKESKIVLDAVEFRKNKLPAKEEESIKERVKDFLERYLEVEQLLNINTVFANPVKKLVIEEVEDVEAAALQLIDKWNLGYDPIPNVIEMLEVNGIRVIELEAPDEFDGLSTYVGKIPVVVINKNYSVERKRFTGLHELGHLVLTIADGADKERICHAFAGALLLPDDCLEKLVGEKRNNIAPGELVNIKEQFGVSIQAIVMRMKVKHIISDAGFNKFWRTIAKNKKEEGLGSFAGREKSYRFEHLVYRLAAEEIVSMSKAANLAGKKLAAFRDEFDALK
ncbi:XRE family transcriptional regulator [Ferruginibacter sp. HRS2-29]|uniref:XRE family transcriptional regulator n=1 Tax=Ferruginibacter sp. HRS2-29 TaxID=2487334 RepID=UPI0020CD16CE|nr:XRE family transcriptional regulator [Ferruginibacter sp. HRS2-29]MCP9750169.1 ImmA/IrrE family metallo-endopeptidase [Ferruginibacter sp. HRS2-29]